MNVDTEWIDAAQGPLEVGTDTAAPDAYASVNVNSTEKGGGAPSVRARPSVSVMRRYGPGPQDASVSGTVKATACFTAGTRLVFSVALSARVRKAVLSKTG